MKGRSAKRVNDGRSGVSMIRKHWVPHHRETQVGEYNRI